jgi:predicted Fe-Mo cluster-binding NifX family protein
MKVAIATFGERVSPRFDCAQTFLLATVDDGQLSERQVVFAAGWEPHKRTRRLIALGVDTVVCGGIDHVSSESLRSAGVRVYGRITGLIEDALAGLLQGELPSDMEEEETVGDGSRSL